jgi:GntR family transcriptional regulator, transcriptional repressor for pyruvate dehydrogenase complex
VAFKSVVRNPVYLQVATEIREAILDGRLVAGQPLPTERELTAEFGVSRATIREALRALQAQGLLSAGGDSNRAGRTVLPEAPTVLGDALGTLLRLRRISLKDLVALCPRNRRHRPGGVGAARRSAGGSKGRPRPDAP